jgi:hypothetical protein
MIRHSSRQPALLISIVVAAFFCLTAGSETAEVFAQAGVADSTLKGKVIDQSDAGERRNLLFGNSEILGGRLSG